MNLPGWVATLLWTAMLVGYPLTMWLCAEYDSQRTVAKWVALVCGLLLTFILFTIAMF